VLNFELRVVERVLGLQPEPDDVVVVSEPEPDAFWVAEPEPEVVSPVEPEPVPEPQPEPEPEPEIAPVAVVVPEPEPEPPAPEPEPPAHLDTESELVGEFAEEGAEEGAGASVHVDEPWEGYRRMRVADIRDRIGVAGSEELAVIQLYEITHRRRRTVLDAVERRSRALADAPARN
jgi:outer membrane biosynthesis protein TonB